MFKIDLEKQLVNGKTSLKEKGLNPRLAQYKRLADAEADSRMLEALGVISNSEFHQLTQKEKEEQNFRKTLEEFNPERIFHEDDIEALCKKYYLKFLKTSNYNGFIPNDLTDKLRKFKEEHPSVTYLNSDTCKIVAPYKEFSLSDRPPADPLFFYRLGKGYYYLVHKWGDDLTFVNRVKGFFSSARNSLLVHLSLIVMASIFTIKACGFFELSENATTGWLAGVITLGVISLVIVGVHRGGPDDTMAWYPNTPTSSYK